MGSYAECWLSTFYIGSTKNSIDPSIMQLFRSSDKAIMSGTKMEIPIQLHRWTEYVDDIEVIDVVYYSASVNIIKDRLNLTGYTLDTCKAVFMKWVDREIQQTEEWANKYKDVFTEHSKFLKMLEVDKWLSALDEIFTKGLKPRQPNHAKDEYDGTLIGYMLDSRNDWYGYPGIDLNVALRLVLEILPHDDEFIYDVTDLILSGYYSKDDDLVEQAIGWTAGNYSSMGKTIVLTEGSTDSWIISESLQLLYPHLADYFTFMDFEGARVGGGAGSLANMVKAFSGAGIVNKVIALFDNDTAAASALRVLNKIQIPSNIKPVQLPELDFLENYPTLGPTGLVDMDINGLAASIELYLGLDVLKDSKENLIPVQWTGYISDIGRYQGEVLSKDEIQKRFKQKLSATKTDKSLLNKLDWEGMKVLLSSLFSAFYHLDQGEIYSFVDEYYGI